MFHRFFRLTKSSLYVNNFMSKLRQQYYTNLRKSLNTALHTSPFPSTWKHLTQSVNSHVVSTNKAITSCCKTGDIRNARKLFDKMPVRTVVSWNTMITGYSKLGMFDEALDLISLMHCSNTKFDKTTFSTSLSVCGRAEMLVHGKGIHGLVLKSGFERFKLVGSSLLFVYGNCLEVGDCERVFDELHEENELLWSLMLNGYVQCGLFSDALSFFDRMPLRGVVEWTMLISGFAKSEDMGKKAIEVFQMMWKSCEAVPNEFTLDCVVRVCGRLGDLWLGRVVHGLVMRLGFEFDFFMSSALIYFYSLCGVMGDAVRVYNGVRKPSLDDSNELVGGLVNLGRMKEAESFFDGMSEKNPVAYNLMIKGYAMFGKFEDSERLFTEMPVKNLVTMNTMISVYAKKGETDKAMRLFEQAKQEGSPITWNSMISGYVSNGQYENAINLYPAMLRSSVCQTRTTFSVLFHACARLVSFQWGQLLHAYVAKTSLSSDTCVGTALIDMYSKCGSISDAKMAFSCIPYPNVASWTALINGYAYHGFGLEAISSFHVMLKCNISPNAATFVAVLSACARTGLIEQGIRLFNSMKEQFGVLPTVEHFTCVVDLIGRAGLVGEAEEFITCLSVVEADKILLISLLNASWFSMDTKVGEWVAEKMFGLDHCFASSACVIMSNMYSGSGKWGETMKIRDHLRDSGGKKDLGCSWIDVNNVFHVFSAHDVNHSDFNMISDRLGSLTRVARTNIQTDSVLLEH